MRRAALAAGPRHAEVAAVTEEITGESITIADSLDNCLSAAAQPTDPRLVERELAMRTETFHP